MLFSVVYRGNNSYTATFQGYAQVTCQVMVVLRFVSVEVLGICLLQISKNAILVHDRAPCSATATYYNFFFRSIKTAQYFRYVVSNSETKLKIQFFCLG